MSAQDQRHVQTTVPLEDVVVDPTVNIRKGTRDETVTRYMDCFQYLPPITVFDTGDGRLLLADGFHRHAAATRLAVRGDLAPAVVTVEVRSGTREEALEYAVVANAAHKENLTDEERDDGIRRLRQLHPNRSEREIGRMMGVSDNVVHRLFVVDRVRQHVLWKPAARIAPSVVYEVGVADQVHWEPLLKAADARKWTRDDVRRVRDLLDDDEVPSDYKRDLVAGKADPLPAGVRTPADVVHLDFSPDARPDAPSPARGAGWRDPVGTDVAERHAPVRGTMMIEVDLPNAEPRQRGLRTYQREALDVTHRVEITVNNQALDGLGDPRNPREERGLAYFCREVSRQLWRALAPTWPYPAETAESAR